MSSKYRAKTTKHVTIILPRDHPLYKKYKMNINSKILQHTMAANTA